MLHTTISPLCVTTILALLATFTTSSCITSPELCLQTNKRTSFNERSINRSDNLENSPGSAQQPITILANDTKYEQLECLGFNPVLNILSATIEVKRPDGFSGGLCTNGSQEYVRFWVDYGNGWDDIGYVSLNTHDIANSLDCNKTSTKPLFYTISINFEPKHNICKLPLLPKVRAKLSWNTVPPTDPYWSPRWGNTIDDHIQSLATDNSESTVYTSGEGTLPTIPDEAMFLPPPDKCNEIEQRALPNPEVQTTKYEEITCLGLDWGLKALVATVRMKLPEGYNDPPCKNSTFEYVSFWADFNNSCNFTLLGTVKFNVHNYLGNFPSAGLSYTAILPVDVTNFSAPCNETRIGRVRAALAYNELPPIPPAVARWGNIIDTHVHLQPYSGLFDPTVPHIRYIGNVDVGKIDASPAGTGMTVKSPVQMANGAWGHADTIFPFDRECPFGGRIKIVGEPVLGHSYRLMYRAYPPPNPNFVGTEVTNCIDVQVIFPPETITICPTTGGWFNYRGIFTNFRNMLSYWTPGPGTWQIRLEMGTQGSHSHEAYTDWYKIHVNNNGPTAHINLTGTGGAVCGDLSIGQTVTGLFDAVSPWFGHYAFKLDPSGLNPHKVTAEPGTDPRTPEAPPGKKWELQTSNATPCGYVVTLWVYDRTVWNSGETTRLHTTKQVGFCLRRPNSLFSFFYSEL